MKAASLFVASLALASLSIAPANAAPARPAPAPVTSPWVGCSISSGTYSSTCRNVANYTSYTQCTAAGMKNGWRDTEVAWYCTSLRLK